MIITEEEFIKYGYLPTDIKKLEKTMEEMAGEPSTRHIRQPGERNAYESTQS